MSTRLEQLGRFSNWVSNVLPTRQRKTKKQVFLNPSIVAVAEHGPRNLT